MEAALLALVLGLGIGFLLGLVGGGGFVIVPALVLLIGMPMELAVGTSLLVIALIATRGPRRSGPLVLRCRRREG